MPHPRSNKNNTSRSIDQNHVAESTTHANNKRAQRAFNRSKAKKTRPTTSQRTRKSRSKPQPVVISLDVTNSESSENTSDIEEISPPTQTSEKPCKRQSSNKSKKNDKNTQSLWPSIRTKDGRYILDSDSDVDVIPKCNTHKDEIISDSSSEDDLYGISSTGQQILIHQTLEEFKKLKNSQKSEDESIGPSIPKNSTPYSDAKQKMTSTGSKARAASYPEAQEEESLDISLENIEVPSKFRRIFASHMRKDKKTKNALASLEAFSKRLKEHYAKTCDSSLDVSDDIIVADKSDLVIYIRWGTEFTRHMIPEDKKFSNLFQELAEKHEVSVTQVILSFKNKTISPEDHPSHIGLTLGDIIEGGIWNKTGLVTDPVSSTEDAHILSLKVQTDNRKFNHTLHLNKFDKFCVLMDAYAKLRKLPLDKLKFKFDGDILQPSDTPAELDLEGGECIDVFES